MTGRIQGATCVLVAVCVLLIFFWPAVPLPVSRVPHSVRPAHMNASVAVAMTPSSRFEFSAQRLSARQARLATRGPDLLDLTTARLC